MPKASKPRPWIRIRVSANPVGWRTLDIFRRWTSIKSASSYMCYAIQMYEALLQNDRREYQRLLNEAFPGVGIGSIINTQTDRVQAPPQPVAVAVEAQQVERSLEDLIARSNVNAMFGDF